MRNNFRKVIKLVQESAEKDMESFREGKIGMQQLESNDMLRGFRLSQQRLQILEAELRILNLCLDSTPKLGIKHREVLVRTIRSIRSEKQAELKIEQKNFDRIDKWWRRKK